jgi:hypothetical protein
MKTELKQFSNNFSEIRAKENRFKQHFKVVSNKKCYTSFMERIKGLKKNLE